MINILVKSPEGFEYTIHANSQTEAGSIIYSLITLGFTILKTEAETTSLDTFFIVRTSDHTYAIPCNNTEQWFTRLAKTIAFDDCSDEAVIFILYQGKEIHYAGWKPNMLIEFEDDTGNTIWSCAFPAWDH